MMKKPQQTNMSKAIVAALLVSQISLSCAKLTSTPVAYLGLGDAGAIPVIDAYDFEVNDAGVWSKYFNWQNFERQRSRRHNANKKNRR